jgi:hypothetical protein
MRGYEAELLLNYTRTINSKYFKGLLCISDSNGPDEGGRPRMSNSDIRWAKPWIARRHR